MELCNNYAECMMLLLFLKRHCTCLGLESCVGGLNFCILRNMGSNPKSWLVATIVSLNKALCLNCFSPTRSTNGYSLRLPLVVCQWSPASILEWHSSGAMSWLPMSVHFCFLSDRPLVLVTGCWCRFTVVSWATGIWCYVTGCRCWFTFIPWATFLWC